MRIGTIPSAELQVDNVTQTVSTVSVSAVVLAANAERKYMKFKNQDAGAQSIFIHFAATPATTTNGLQLLSGETYSEGVGTGLMIYTGEVRAISSSGTNNLYVEERY